MRYFLVVDLNGSRRAFDFPIHQAQAPLASEADDNTSGRVLMYDLGATNVLSPTQLDYIQSFPDALTYRIIPIHADD